MNAKRTRRSASRGHQRVPSRLRLRISLRHVEPPVWREITVPDSYSLFQLHRCIQLIFDWLDYHLFEFRIGSRSFEAVDPEATGEDAARFTLAELGLKAGSSLLYIYDMGDRWEHDIRVQAVEAIGSRSDPDLLAYVVDGARAAPPEDIGGPPGYERLVRAFSRRTSDDDTDLIDWAGPGFDPELFDRRGQNHALVLATAWGMI